MSERPKHRVLVVEERSSQRILFEMVLRDAGYQVYSLEQAEGLEAFVRVNRPDVVVLDPCKPGDDPHLRCEELQAPPLGVPVIIYSTCDCLDQAEHPNGVRFAPKTSDPSNLIRLLKRLLESEVTDG